MKTYLVHFTLTLALAAAGCGDDTPSPAPDAAAAPDGAPSVGGAVTPDGAAPPVVGIAVVNSDYKSTSVSLLDPVTNEINRDDCLTSGSKPPGLSLALSGDVVLPTSPQPGHELLLIDRTNSALTYLDPATCAVRKQVAVGTGFFSNPQDVVGLSASKAYVLRYERNAKATPDPADLDDGDDVLIIDPSQGKAVGRIALGSYASGAGTTARPAHAALVGGKVYVALDSLNADFSVAGDGRLVVIDPATDMVAGTVDLPGLKGCNGLDPVPGTSTLVVTCAGVFSDGDLQVNGSAIVFLDVGATPVATTGRLAAALFGGRALSGVALTSATTGLAVTAGTPQAMPPDQLWGWDATTGSTAQLLATKEGFVLGAVLSDLASHRAYVTDATMDAPGVKVYDVTAVPSNLTSVISNPAHGLPPRDLAWY